MAERRKSLWSLSLPPLVAATGLSSGLQVMCALALAPLQTFQELLGSFVAGR
jgi:hypothetical protein